MQLKQLIKDSGVRFTFNGGPRLDWSKQSTWQRMAIGYTCTLTYKGRSMTTDYWQGRGIKSPPDAAGVLESLLLDASGFDNARDFFDWCSDYGLEQNDKEAKKTYQAVKSQTTKVKTLLGDDYETFLSAET